MFTQAKIETGKKTDPLGYALEVAHQQDYYNEKEKTVGKWQGKLAEELGLLNKDITVDSKEFTEIFNGINPKTQNKLTQRKTNVRFFDLQNSCDKSISIMATLGEDKRLIDIHNKATEKVLKYIEEFAQVRERSGDNYNTENVKDTGSLLIAKFTHETSRSLDPQLHTHCMIANITKDIETGKYHALQNEKIYKNLAYFSRMYDNELAKEVQKIGYEIENRYTDQGTIKGFKLKGISDDLCANFSKGRLQLSELIESFKSRNNREPSTQEINSMAKYSRAAKLYNLSKNDINKIQSSQLSNEDIKEIQSVRIRSEKQSENAAIIDIEAQTINAIESELNHILERKSIIKKEDFKKEILHNNIGSIDIDIMDKYLDNSPGLLRIKGHITRHEVFKEELEVIEFVNKGKNVLFPLNKDYKAFNSAEHILNETEKGYDYKEQRKVIEAVLQNKDNVVIIRGLAGAGKTTAVAELDAGLKNIGKEAFYYAPQTGAVEAFSNEEYFKEAGRAANTVASLIFRAKNKELDELKNKTLVIDEAGQLSAQSGKALINIAEKYNCKLIFVGDSKQHNAVDRGDFMRLLEEYSDITKVELRGIRRQRNKDHLKAVYDLADGKAAKGLERIDKLGWMTEDENYLKIAADKYIELINNKTEFKDIISISPTHREGEKFTEYIRSGLLENSILGEEKVDRLRFKSSNLTEERKRHIKNYKVGHALSFREKSGSFKPNDTRVIKEIKSNHVILNDGNKFYPIKSGIKIDVGILKKVNIRKGDLIRPTANNKKVNLINGKLYEVKSIDDNKVTLFDSVNYKDIILDNDFAQFNHGYVVTSHKSQGSTLETTIIAAKRQDAKADYVSLSRSRGKTYIYTESRTILNKSAEDTGNKDAVHDINLSYEELIRNKDPKFLEEVAKVKTFEYFDIRVKEYSSQMSLKGVEQVGSGENTLRSKVKEEFDSLVQDRNLAAHIIVNSNDGSISPPAIKTLGVYGIKKDKILEYNRNYNFSVFNSARIDIGKNYELLKKTGEVQHKDKIDKLVEKRDFLAYGMSKDYSKYKVLLDRKGIDKDRFDFFAESGRDFKEKNERITDYLNNRNESHSGLKTKALDIVDNDKNYKQKCIKIANQYKLNSEEFTNSIQKDAYDKIVENLPLKDISNILYIKKFDELSKEYNNFWACRSNISKSMFTPEDWTKIKTISLELESMGNIIKNIPVDYKTGLKLYAVSQKTIDKFSDKYQKTNFKSPVDYNQTSLNTSNYAIYNKNKGLYFKINQMERQGKAISTSGINYNISKISKTKDLGKTINRLNNSKAIITNKKIKPALPGNKKKSPIHKSKKINKPSIDTGIDFDF